MSEIEIRPLKLSDLLAVARLVVGYSTHEIYVVEKQESPEQTVVSLRLEAVPEPYTREFTTDEETMAIYRDLLRGDYCFGVYKGEQLVAITMAEYHAWNRTFWIWEFHVEESHRGQGIGRQLMEFMCHQAYEAGARVVLVETQNTNVPAIRFYRALGFAIEGLDLSYYDPESLDVGDEIAVFMKRHVE
ncbi:MAG: GNAT family N-acetyltransferase [Ardenticatenaceae bacterium]|nr:GNAT family N-acetyltransferase [Anaerolineales bacterium]MCB8921860.1 GNAT family N-acetyltransferase [Ardenticatenaceae bacterium]MCB8990982.1 GNAT family N-acetyltransferase [Ardenticatenaceae bacterium]MCB9005338.1 GNAT family N-acetyltransferase [Ardenticatenaceae bacterium]